MNKTIASFAALGLLLLATAVASADDKSGLYSTNVTGTLVSGKAGKLTLKILPAKGYKWNKDYPAKIKLSNGSKVAFTKDTYKKVKGEIQGDDKGATIDLQCKGKASGTESVEAVASFSICNEETCHVLRKRVLKLQVTVK